MEKKQYTYYAFISYKREDARWAQWLQRRLQTYKLPIKTHESHQDLPRKLTPVFLDKTNLRAGRLREQLKEEVTSSKYLIVICSRAAHENPKYLDMETRFFLEHGGDTSRIIPVIVDRTEHPVSECYPSLLEELNGEESILGVNVPADGKQQAMLKIISYMQGIKLEELESDESRRRKKKFRLYAAGGLAALCLAAGAVWWNIPHTASFREYIYRWELPEGVGKLNAAQAGAAEYSYRFTRLRGKTVSVERINSSGTLKGGTGWIWEDPARVEFYYDNSGKLNRTEYFDENGHKLYEAHYSTDLRAVDMVRYGTGISMNITASILRPQTNVGNTGDETRHGDITRFYQTYDESGRRTLRLFKRDNRGDQGGTPTQDIGSGIWGVRYLWDEQDRLAGVRFTDRDGGDMCSYTGAAGADYLYNENGLPVRQTNADAEGKPLEYHGTAYYTVQYDENGRITEQRSFGADGLPARTADGNCAKIMTYNEKGNRLTETLLDADDEPVAGSALGVCRTAMEYDRLGRVARQAFQNGNGEPATASNGIASMTTEYDGDSNRPALRRFFDTEGKPALYPATGAYAMRYTYNEDRMMSRIEYLDADLNPMVSAEGIAALCYEYSDGKRVKEYYLDLNGDPVRSSSGFAAITFEYEENNCISESMLDEEGNLCAGSGGTAVTEYEYQGGINTAEASFDANHEPALNIYGYHRVEKLYNEMGLETEERYYGTDGKTPVCRREGFASMTSAYHPNGDLASRSFFGEDGKPTAYPPEKGCSTLAYDYDRSGNVIRIRYLARGYDPSEDEQERFVTVYGYDAHGNLTDLSDLCCLSDSLEIPLEDGLGGQYISQYNVFFLSTEKGTLFQISRMKASDLFENATGEDLVRMLRENGTGLNQAFMEQSGFIETIEDEPRTLENGLVFIPTIVYGQGLQTQHSCYLIHGDDLYMIWSTASPSAGNDNTEVLDLVNRIRTRETGTETQEP